MVNAEEELKLLENSVRDVIALVLSKKFGADWINSLRITSERIQKWRERKEAEETRLRGVPLETRLIYYADFYDLSNIIDKHWDDDLRDVFQDKKNTMFFLKEAEKFRDPHAHRRELFDYQKHLIKGISGEIRTRIMMYRGKGENPDNYFPVIEAANDSIGNGVTNPGYARIVVSEKVMRVGDSVEIICYSSDPMGGELLYSIAKQRMGFIWRKENKSTVTFKREDIGRICDIHVYVKSDRRFHAYGEFDEYVSFRYVVIPA